MQSLSEDVSENLQKMTIKFGTHDGLTYKVALDAYEAKFHCRFANVGNFNSHGLLKNWNEGINAFL